MKTKRFHLIDFLRFFAALMVMLYHYMLSIPNAHQSPVSYEGFSDWAIYNYLAVNLFFVISGFVILQSADGSSPTSFIKSRITRLYPVYWVCCTLSFFLIYYFVNDFLHLSFARYLLNMTMLNGFLGVGYVDGVYWTLFVELKFYILILALLVLNKGQYIEWAMRSWLGLSVLTYLLNLTVIENLTSANFSAFFVAGCTLYQAKKHGWSPMRLLTILVSLLMGVLFEFRNGIVKSNYYHTSLSFIIIGVIISSIFLIVWLATNTQIKKQNLQEFCAKVGRISYPLYLIHFNVGLVLFNLYVNEQVKWIGLLLISAVMICTASILNKYVELPLSKKLKTILDKRLINN